MTPDDKSYSETNETQSEQTDSSSSGGIQLLGGTTFDVQSFLNAASQLSELQRGDSHFVVNIGESDEKRLRVAHHPCECSIRWFDIPTAAIENVSLLGVELCCGMILPHVFLKLKPDFDSLLITFSEMRSDRSFDITPFDDNRLRADTIANVAWQWDNNPTSCRLALQYAHTDAGRALNNLKSGQSHNPGVQNLYGVAHSRLGDFWDIVATTTYGSPNFDDATINLNWQYSNNLGSMDAADREWRINRRKYSALFELLTGQRHNTGVMHQYRACYAADANRLFGIVRRILGT